MSQDAEFELRVVCRDEHISRSGIQRIPNVDRDRISTLEKEIRTLCDYQIRKNDKGDWGWWRHDSSSWDWFHVELWWRHHQSTFKERVSGPFGKFWRLGSWQATLPVAVPHCDHFGNSAETLIAFVIMTSPPWIDPVGTPPLEGTVVVAVGSATARSSSESVSRWWQRHTCQQRYRIGKTDRSFGSRLTSG